MSQITRCPACQTTFKVVADQLRISGGWVRCGHCKEVFDATANMLAVEVKPAPAPVAPVPSEPVPVTVPATVSEPPSAAPAAPVSVSVESPVEPRADVWSSARHAADKEATDTRAADIASAAPAGTTQIAPPTPVAAPVEHRPWAGYFAPSGPAPLADQASATPTVNFSLRRETDVVAPGWKPDPLPEILDIEPRPDAVVQPEPRVDDVDGRVEPTQHAEPSADALGNAFNEPTVDAHFPSVAPLSAASELSITTVQEPVFAREPEPEPEPELRLVDFDTLETKAGATVAAAVAALAEERQVTDSTTAQAGHSGSAPETRVEPVMELSPVPSVLVESGVQASIDADERHEPGLEVAAHAQPETTAKVQVTDVSETEVSDKASTDVAPAAPELAAAAVTSASSDSESKRDVDDESSEDDVGFIRAARRKAFWRKPVVRFGLVLLALLLAGLLVGQYAVAERDRVVANYPQTRPLLEKLCHALDCKIGAPRQISAVAIDSSTFSRVDGDPNAFRLQVTLKSSADVVLEMPVLEVTLTDAQDQAVLRRVLLPTETGAPAELPAQGSWAGLINLQVPEVAARVTGYRLVAFYP